MRILKVKTEYASLSCPVSARLGTVLRSVHRLKGSFRGLSVNSAVPFFFPFNYVAFLRLKTAYLSSGVELVQHGASLMTFDGPDADRPTSPIYNGLESCGRNG